MATATFDYSVALNSVQHSKEFYSDILVEYVTLADVHGPNSERIGNLNYFIEVTDSDGITKKVPASSPFIVSYPGDFYEEEIESYLPSGSQVYAIDARKMIGFAISLSASVPKFPELQEIIKASYSGETSAEAGAKLEAALAEYSRAFDKWYADVDSTPISSVQLINQQGAIGNLSFGLTLTPAGALRETLPGLLDRDSTITGSEFADELTGYDGKDVISGGGGSDTIRGGDNNDELKGGAGADILDGGEGADKFDGGADTDLVTYAFGSGAIGLKLGADGRSFGDAAGDVLLSGVEGILGSNFDDEISLASGDIVVFGGGGSDQIWGSTQDDILFGDFASSNASGSTIATMLLLARAGAGGVAGNDYLYGGLGADKLYGGNGNDHLYSNNGSESGPDSPGNELYGEDGNDELIAFTSAGAVADKLFGGTGTDKFFVDNGDRLKDFEIGEKLYVYGGASIGRTIVYSDQAGTKINVFSAGSSSQKIATVYIDERIDPKDLRPGADVVGGFLTFEREVDGFRILNEALTDTLTSVGNWCRRFSNIDEPLAQKWVADILATTIIPSAISKLNEKFSSEILSQVEMSLRPQVESAFKERTKAISEWLLQTALEQAAGRDPALADTAAADFMKIAFAPIISQVPGADWAVTIGEMLIKGIFIELDIARDAAFAQDLRLLPDAESYEFKDGKRPSLTNSSVETSGGATSTAVDAIGVAAAKVTQGKDFLLSGVSVLALKAGIESAKLLDVPPPGSNFLPASLAGNEANNLLFGNASANVIAGLDGADEVYGEDGNDALRGGLGADTLAGNGGTDLFYFAAADLQAGVRDTVTDYSGGETIRFGAVNSVSVSATVIGGNRLLTIAVSGGNAEILVKGNGVLTTVFGAEPGTLTPDLASNYANVTTKAFDLANANAWRTDTRAYDVLQRLDTVDVLNDDGTRVFTDFDQGGTRTDTSTQTIYDNLGRTDIVDVRNDSGTRIYTDFDQGSTRADLSTLTAYDNLSRVDYVDVRNDNGTRIFTDFDQASARVDASTLTAYDNLGRVDYVDVRNDNGTRIFTDFDQANARADASTLTAYDNLSRIDYVDVRNDDGTRVFTDFDQAGARADASTRTLYDTLGRIDIVDVINDDGSRVFTDFDQANANATASTRTVYDKLNRIDYIDIIRDNGTRQFTDLDQAGIYSWSSTRTEYAANGSVISVTTIPD